MPHKHKRKRDDDTSNFDLDPSSRARPLAAYDKASIFSKDDGHTSTKRRKPNSVTSRKLQDDTPKAFARLMAWHTTGKRPNGLDDGKSIKASKKQRKETQPSKNQSDPQPTSSGSVSNPTSTPAPSSKSTTNTTTTVPKILPGETLSNFALRVDQSLPLTSLARSNAANTLPEDLRAKLKKSQRTTKHNKRLQRMQADWRTTEAKLQEKEAEKKDELEDQREEEDLLWSNVRSANRSRKGKKKRTKGGPEDDDPWKDLEKRRREETKQRNLQDVVQAPPVLKKVNSKFKTRAEDFDAVDGKSGGGDGGDEEALVDVSNVPNAVGSLRRREELNATRKAVIEGYRKMHGRKRGVGERLALSKAITT